jgi:hypothetical protein
LGVIPAVKRMARNKKTLAGPMTPGIFESGDLG